MDEQLEQELLEEQKKLQEKQRLADLDLVAASAAKRAAVEKQIAELRNYFGPGSSSSAANTLRLSEPEKYKSLRRLAVQHGLVFDSSVRNTPAEPTADSSRFSYGQRANPGAGLLDQHYGRK